MFISLFKFEQSILLVTLGSAAWLVQELLGHIWVWMMLIEELNGMKTAAVDVKVDVATVEIRGAGFPHFNLWMHRFYGFPDGLADTFALNAHLHIEEC